MPAHLAVKAMRDSGYKNAAYALAELMDNAIQAGASEVELLCGERTTFVSERECSRIHQIAVLDNGSGMDARVLRMALQFGNGTHLTAEEQTGIGKFGMGLPNSSISQCRHVDVWSWQRGPESALHTSIDIDDIIAGRQHEVPAPEPRPIPDVWRQASRTFGASGTLVVWSNLDRVTWKTARAIIRNSERLIGRMYRKFIDRGQTRIRLCAFDFDRPSASPGQDDFARPNDPTYLMADTSCPDPPGGEPMFELWGKPKISEIIGPDGIAYEVKVAISQAKKKTRKGYNPGSKKHGKHAEENMGVSVVRAGRELEMNNSWDYEPTDRWWGVEVEFPPALDDVFGVSNNKQTARNFRKIDIAGLREDGGSKKRQAEGFRGKSDEGESQPEETRKREIAGQLEGAGYTETDAADIAESVLKANAKYQFVEECLQQDLFGRVRQANGRWAVKTAAPSPATKPARQTTEPVNGSEGNGGIANDGEGKAPIHKFSFLPEQSGRNGVDEQEPKEEECIGAFGNDKAPSKWHAAQGAHPTPPRREKSAAEPAPEKAPASLTAFMPSSLAGHVTADLESAKRLALVLGLSSRPLSAADLSQVMGEMGWSIPPEKAERLLAGPLQQYARCEEGRWRLHPIAPLEGRGAAGDEPPKKATGNRHALNAQTQSDGMAYQFGAADLDAPAFFAAKMEGAATVEIQLNTGHPAYELLRGVETASTQEAEAQTPHQLLRQSQRALRLLLVGWARYEEDLEGPRRRRAQKARSDWGRRVRRVMQRGGGPSWEGPPAK